MTVGWTLDVVETIEDLTNILWYLDSHHQKFLPGSIHLLKELCGFQGFNDWKRKKDQTAHSY